MDVCEPRVRRRGFFLHSDTTGEDHTEHESAEGLVVRIRISRGADASRPLARQTRGSSGSRMSTGRSRLAARDHAQDNNRPEIRSGSVTGSRQRAHLPR